METSVDRQERLRHYVHPAASTAATAVLQTHVLRGSDAVVTAPRLALCGFMCLASLSLSFLPPLPSCKGLFERGAKDIHMYMHTAPPPAPHAQTHTHTQTQTHTHTHTHTHTQHCFFVCPSNPHSKDSSQHEQEPTSASKTGSCCRQAKPTLKESTAACIAPNPKSRTLEATELYHVLSLRPRKLQDL